MTVDFKPIKTRRTFEEITELIKEKIFSGEFKPGDQLPTERDMAQMVQVSRSAVREAYHALELLGIVQIRKGVDGGTFIREPNNLSITQSINDLLRLRGISLDEMMETRMVLEKDLAAMAIKRITPDGIKKLENCIKESFEVLNQNKPAHRENIKFHLCLAELSGNRLLLMVYNSVMDLFKMVLHSAGANYEMSKIIAEEHQKILFLLKNGEIIQLLSFLDEHIRGSNERLLEISKTMGIPGLDTTIIENKKANG